MNTRIIDPESDESSQGRDSGHSPRPDQSSPVKKKTRAWSIVRRSTTTSHLLCHTTTRDHQSPASSALSATTTTTTHPPSTTTTPPRTNQPPPHHPSSRGGLESVCRGPPSSPLLTTPLKTKAKTKSITTPESHQSQPPQLCVVVCSASASSGHLLFFCP